MRISDWSSDVCSSDLNWARAGELTYGIIPDLERRLATAAEAEQGRMLKEEVTDEEIASVVSRWTGVPVDRMLEGERDKLLRMRSEERSCRERVCQYV